MNYYIVCEGEKTELLVYSNWIPSLNSSLVKVDSFLELNQNNFYMISGCGYPNYFNIITNSVSDIMDNNINAILIIIVDAEDFTFEEKYKEINDFLENRFRNFSNYKIVVQTPSMEGWCLGNRRFISNSPQSETLTELITHYNVRKNEPENILPYQDNNKAQTSTKYLKEAAKEKNVTYSKARPNIISDVSFLTNLKKRCELTNHLSSFKKFTEIFETN